MLRRFLLASVLFGILGSGSGCTLLDRVVHCEKYCGSSCGPKYWGPYHVDRCDPCDTCGNFVAEGYPNTASRCGLAGHGQGCGCSGGQDGQYQGGGHYDGGHYDGEVIYEDRVRDAPVYENAVYERSARGHTRSVSYGRDVSERKIPIVWRNPW